MSAAYDRIQDALTAAGSRGRGSAWQCQAHEDRNASLSVNQGNKGVVLKCHAGCSIEDILEALGLTKPDLFDDPLDRSRGYAVIAEYQYVDEDGVLLYIKERRLPKDFRQRRKGLDDKWIWNLDNTRHVLYNLPNVIKARDAGDTIYIVEGEADADRLNEMGLVATTCTEGAGGNWLPEYTNTLKTAKSVVIIADNDNPGFKRAECVRRELEGSVPDLRVVKSATTRDKDDVSDHLNSGYDIKDLVPVEDKGQQQLNCSSAEPGRRRLILTAASDIEPEPVIWAWEDEGFGRIPAGSFGLAAGREGTGKSSYGLWLTAKITTGTLPGKFYGKPRNVIIVAVEDSWKHTIVPRLIAAGADRTRVFRTEVQTEESDELTLSLPLDNCLLEEAITEYNVALVLIDPLMSAVSDNIDTHKEREVRRALDPLAKLAARTDAIILGIAHFNKASSTDAASLITGSGAFKNVARFIFGFAKDDEEQTLVMTQVKNSLGRSDLPSLTYRVISAIVPTSKGDTDVGRFVVDGVSDRTVAEVLATANKGDRDPRPGEEAEEFLRRVLAQGPAMSKAVEEEARMLGIAPRTLKRIRTKMGVVSRKTGSEWWISLPEHSGDMAA